jgi:hypothetical protein
MGERWENRRLEVAGDEVCGRRDVIGMRDMHVPVCEWVFLRMSASGASSTYGQDSEEIGSSQLTHTWYSICVEGPQKGPRRTWTTVTMHDDKLL